jgi:hypothetical protein
MLNSLVDLCGFAAAALTLATFAQRAMLRMRVTALFANVFFIMYGWLGPFYPVLILHMILLPVNTVRLREVTRRSRRLAVSDVATPVPLLDAWQSRALKLSRAPARRPQYGWGTLLFVARMPAQRRR